MLDGPQVAIIYRGRIAVYLKCFGNFWQFVLVFIAIVCHFLPFSGYFFGSKNMGPERFGSKKIWGPKKVGAKKCRLKNSGPKKLRPLKNCLVKLGQ